MNWTVGALERWCIKEIKKGPQYIHCTHLQTHTHKNIYTQEVKRARDEGRRAMSFGIEWKKTKANKKESERTKTRRESEPSATEGQTHSTYTTCNNIRTKHEVKSKGAPSRHSNFLLERKTITSSPTRVITCAKESRERTKLVSVYVCGSSKVYNRNSFLSHSFYTVHLFYTSVCQVIVYTNSFSVCMRVGI